MARIILIDDDDDVRRPIRRFLERAGHQVLEASDGEAGLNLLAQSGVDLVITDIFMPGQDGIVTVRRIRKEFPQVKVIAVSGGDRSGRLDLRRDAELLGADKSLKKPFNLADLLEAVREVLGLGPEAR
jgi:DNA-binding response OmpR family regulator